MGKKKNQNNRNVKSGTVKTSVVNNLAEKKNSRNEFMRNQPVLYIIFAIAAFIVGNYLFDLIGRIF